MSLYHINEPITSLIPTCVGECTSYSISPSLPSGLIINTSTGIISGTPLEMMNQTDFTITVSNRDASSSFVIKIKVVERMCAQDGIWEATAYGNTAYAFCENSNSQTQYRECLLEGLTTSWGEINSSMCASSGGGDSNGSGGMTTTLPDEPEKGHAFILFSIPNTEKNPEDYTPQNMYALYSSLFNFFDSEKASIDGISIRIDPQSTTSFHQDQLGSIMRFTVGVVESELESIKERLVEYLKASFYEDVIAADPSFGEIPFEFKVEQMVEIFGPILTTVEIAIIVSATICVVLVVGGVIIWYSLKQKSKKTLNKEKKQKIKHPANITDNIPIEEPIKI